MCKTLPKGNRRNDGARTRRNPTVRFGDLAIQGSAKRTPSGAFGTRSVLRSVGSLSKPSVPKVSEWFSKGNTRSALLCFLVGHRFGVFFYTPSRICGTKGPRSGHQAVPLAPLGTGGAPSGPQRGPWVWRSHTPSGVYLR